jgi:hypothetical protein
MTDSEIRVIRSYIEASRTVVYCRQKKLKLSCQACKKYYNNAMCPTYRIYVDAWRELQKLVPENDNHYQDWRMT